MTTKTSPIIQWGHWEDSECAGVLSITCGDCGKSDKDVEAVRHGQVWKCANCGRAIVFIWQGMTFRDADDAEKEKENIF